MKTDIKAIENLLITNPEARDSDDKLYSYILYRWLNNTGNIDVRATELLKAMWRGELPKYESITRARRKLQEENPNLRGKRWDERHKKAERVRQDVNELF